MNRKNFNLEDVDSVLEHFGLRKTKARQIILEILLKEAKPLTAQAILERIEAEDYGEEIWLSTIYRNLEQFQDKHMIQTVSQLESDTLLYRLELGKHNHYAVCESCHMQIPLDLCPIEDIDQDLERQGFTPTTHVLEVFGICEECKRRANH